MLVVVHPRAVQVHALFVRVLATIT